MDEFKVKIGQVRSASTESKQMANELSGIQSELYGVKSRISFQISHRERIDRRLTMQGQALESEKKKMDQIASALSDIADQYEKTEKELCGEKASFSFADVIRLADDFAFPDLLPIPPYPVIPGILNLVLPNIQKFFPVIEVDEDRVSNMVQSLVDTVLTGQSSDSEEDESDNGKIKPIAEFKADTGELGDVTKELDDKISKFKDDHSKDLKSSKKEYDRATNTWSTIDENDQNAVDQFDEGLKKGKMEAAVKAGIGTSASASLWDWESKGGHVKAYAGKAEGKIEGYAGLYQRDPNTGEFEFKPGIGGSIGGSVTAFTAEEEAMLGGDMLGVYAKSSQTVGRLGGNVEGSIGLYDETGKLNPSAYVGGSLEAIAGEITGSAGAKILGTDVGVSGSLNYGVGAHANVGFHDGKVSLDVGATLGVGASVKLEIDVGGTVEAVCDVAKAAWDDLQKWKFW